MHFQILSHKSCFHKKKNNNNNQFFNNSGILSKHDVDKRKKCNHFSIIQTHYAWKMYSNHPGIKLEPALGA